MPLPSPDLPPAVEPARGRPRKTKTTPSQPQQVLYVSPATTPPLTMETLTTTANQPYNATINRPRRSTANNNTCYTSSTRRRTIEGPDSRMMSSAKSNQVEQSLMD
eukprot:scpid107997/ scgid20198/ 